jgi:hypothetical protein
VRGNSQASFFDDLVNDLSERHARRCIARAAIPLKSATMKQRVDDFTWCVNVKNCEQVVPAIDCQFNASEDMETSEAVHSLVLHGCYFSVGLVNPEMSIMIGYYDRVDIAAHVRKEPVSEAGPGFRGFPLFCPEVK